MVEVHSPGCSSRCDKFVAAPLLLVFDMGKQSGLFKKIPRLAWYYTGAIFYVDKRGISTTLGMDGRCRAAEEERRTFSSIMPQTHDLGQQGWEKLSDKLKAHGKPPVLTCWDLITGSAVPVPACQNGPTARKGAGHLSCFSLPPLPTKRWRKLEWMADMRD